MKKAYIIRIVIVTIIGILSILEIFNLINPQIIENIQFATLFHKLFISFSALSLLTLICLIILTFIFGRIYCSTVCPFGIIQEGFDILQKKLSKKKKKNCPQTNYRYKYIIALIGFLTLMFNFEFTTNFIDPYMIFKNTVTFSKLSGIIISVLVIALVFFRNRFFCTNICPVGAVLGLISKYSFLKIKLNKSNCVACGVCARSCPSGCIKIKEGEIDNEMCIKCLKCIRVCPENTINYHKDEALKLNLKSLKAKLNNKNKQH